MTNTDKDTSLLENKINKTGKTNGFKIDDKVKWCRTTISSNGEKIVSEMTGVLVSTGTKIDQNNEWFQQYGKVSNNGQHLPKEPFVFESIYKGEPFILKDEDGIRNVYPYDISTPTHTETLRKL